jgi:hypothetical protein
MTLFQAVAQITKRHPGIMRAHAFAWARQCQREAAEFQRKKEDAAMAESWYAFKAAQPEKEFKAKFAAAPALSEKVIARENTHGNVISHDPKTVSQRMLERDAA